MKRAVNKHDEPINRQYKHIILLTEKEAEDLSKQLNKEIVRASDTMIGISRSGEIEGDVPMNPEYTTGGYRCGVCGDFVMYGTTHICGGRKTYDFTTGDVKINHDDKLDQIIELLKQIVRRL